MASLNHGELPYVWSILIDSWGQFTLQWRHNDHDGVSNHQPHCCLPNLKFRRRSKKTSKLRVTGLCAGNSPGPVNSPHKGPVTRKMFPFDDVIMNWQFMSWYCKSCKDICGSYVTKMMIQSGHDLAHDYDITLHMSRQLSCRGMCNVGA